MQRPTATALHHRCEVRPEGVVVPVAVGETLLAALHRYGVHWPSSCRNGTCRTCLGQMASGQIRHTIDWPGLSLEEKLSGAVLPCVAEARSDVVLDRQTP